MAPPSTERRPQKSTRAVTLSYSLTEGARACEGVRTASVFSSSFPLSSHHGHRSHRRPSKPPLCRSRVAMEMHTQGPTKTSILLPHPRVPARAGPVRPAAPGVGIGSEGITEVTSTQSCLTLVTSTGDMPDEPPLDRIHGSISKWTPRTGLSREKQKCRCDPSRRLFPRWLRSTQLAKGRRAAGGRRRPLGPTEQKPPAR